MTAPRPPTQPPVTVRREPPADTGLHGRWLLLAHAGWAAVMLLTLGFLILAVPYRFRQARAICVTADCPIPQLSPAGEQALRQLGLSLDFFAANVTVVGLVFVLIFVAVGGMIVWRRSDDWMALYVSLTLVLSGSTAVPFVDVLAQAQPDWRLPLQAARAVGLGAGLLLLFIFPNGRFVPGWTRWFALGLGVWIVVSSLNLLAYASQPWWLAFLGWFGIGVWAQLYRYRRVSTPVERQQTKWVVFGCAHCLPRARHRGAPAVTPSSGCHQPL